MPCAASAVTRSWSRYRVRCISDRSETLSRWLAANIGTASHVVLDLKRVTSLDDGAVQLLTATVQGAVEAGRRIVGACLGVTPHSHSLHEVLTTGGAIAVDATLDDAIERCEDELLVGLGLRHRR